MFIINSIKKEFADKLLFENFDLTIYDGEKVGIVGSNGSGKSTLMNLLAKDITPDAGTIHFNGRLAYLRQANDKLGFNIKNLNDNIDFKKIKSELKLANPFNQMSANFDSLSGGEKTKLFISECFSKDFDTLLLDEPTNNLDSHSIDWLIKKVKDFKGTVVIVSHDRYFLNETINKIIEIENGKINEYYGNYDMFESQKKQNLLSQKRQYEKEKAYSKKLERQVLALRNKVDNIERSIKSDGSPDCRVVGYKSSRQTVAKKTANQMRAKSSLLDKIKDNSTEQPYEKRKIQFSITGLENKSRILIKASGLTKRFDANILFENANFIIENGDRVAIIGDNGTGKSTLIKMILGEIDYIGSIWTSSSLKIGYLSQDVFNLDCNLTVFEYSNQFNSEYRTKFLTNLSNMGVNRQVFNRKIDTLSLGERMKIKLNEVILSDFNLLILDEPTNHLDLENRLFLEEVLSDYKGSLLLVSHDKFFVDRICNKKLIIKDKKISYY